ncbi:hypothetical protein DUI87_15262 [Hirundo rustica rustica]|uniref:Uncharacterized protein n=1 Tax=Hirundo rustica rustica TaxID=333673 RepID=A0A3M0K3N1_HIRRU|nr:hypothetical protein DUI87_15262 [Hirundo rustica rustica]
MTPGEIFSQPFTQLFGPTPPVFEGFKSLNVNDIIQWLVLLVCPFCLAFRDKGRLTWITTLIPTLENKDTAPQPASGINHPDWVKEICEMGQMLREYLCPVVASLAPAAGKPSPCPDKGESDGAAAEPTDVTTVQVPAEPQGQPQPAAVAPVETKKYKVKSEHPGNKDKKGGPSQPREESEVEIITESLTYESLRNLQKDLARRGREAYTTWLLRVWDLIGTGMQLDSSEARNLGPLTPDSGVNQVEEQRVPIATSTVHRRQYRTNRDAVIPIHKMIRELESQGVVSKPTHPLTAPSGLCTSLTENGD